MKDKYYPRAVGTGKLAPSCFTPLCSASGKAIEKPDLPLMFLYTLFPLTLGRRKRSHLDCTFLFSVYSVYTFCTWEEGDEGWVLPSEVSQVAM